MRSRAMRDLKQRLRQRLAGEPVSEPGADRPSASVACRRRILATGRILAIGVRPRSDGVNGLFVDLEDATIIATDLMTHRPLGSLDETRIRLIWSGTHAIPGITPGAVLTASGVETRIKGRLCLIGPAYELCPPAEPLPTDPVVRRDDRLGFGVRSLNEQRPR